MGLLIPKRGRIYIYFVHKNAVCIKWYEDGQHRPLSPLECHLQRFCQMEQVFYVSCELDMPPSFKALREMQLNSLSGNCSIWVPSIISKLWSKSSRNLIFFLGSGNILFSWMTSLPDRSVLSSYYPARCVSFQPHYLTINMLSIKGLFQHRYASYWDWQINFVIFDWAFLRIKFCIFSMSSSWRDKSKQAISIVLAFNFQFKPVRCVICQLRRQEWQLLQHYNLMSCSLSLIMRCLF